MAALAGSGCVGTGRDVHLAPLYSNLSTAGGGREVEMLFGAVRIRHPAPQAKLNEWAFRPFVSEQIAPNGNSLARFVVPLGTRLKTSDDYLFRLLPIIRYRKHKDEQGRTRWRFMLFPLILWGKEPNGDTVKAFFPFGGVVDNFLIFDRLSFFLFPLFLQSQVDDVTTRHFLWPIFAWGRGELGVHDRKFTKTRFFPFFGRKTIEGSQDRRFYMWPFFHWHRAGLSRPEEQQMRKWHLWPIYGHTKQGTFRAHTSLWPFFGYAHDPKSGFWAWDGPWPLVRIQRPGESDRAVRTRVWPLYGHYKDAGIETKSVLWPLIRARTENNYDNVRKGFVLIPFYQDWEQDFDDGRRATWTKVWPLWQYKTDPGKERFALIALNPLWYQPVIDDHYAWLYELITREVDGESVKVRSWGGLWRQELDEHEDRSSLTGIWASRRYQRNDEEVTETSLLFGLLRWRSGAGFQLLPPAFPGPGWPVERTRRRLPESSQGSPP